ncbi:Alpha-xylosidase [Neolecta irregularis DAH-3]|uniref:alpha-D-xyloside xylohydrolase n=1 Tax=Neolecta irregularis (strain DAH-3) TaxID=1198029 RepID=A0A1U7LJ71_NEOID|nr:Alpha-xylosidase [Neolecta irregularis DAH-3]|eukprot:OLL22602.1 Alpha-xylosidase [Neolecta irregularis DAH-3]
MKFSNGRWMLAEGTEIDYATEVIKLEKTDSSIRGLLATRHIRNRGDTLNSGTITLDIESRWSNIVKISATHWDGKLNHGPNFELFPDGEPDRRVVSVYSTDTVASLESEELRVDLRLKPNGFGLDFSGGGKPLTAMGFRSLCYIKKHPSSFPYLLTMLDLDVGETVYGLGERFGPFVKNGQEIEIWNRDGGTSSEQAYKNVSFYMTSNGYGVFVNTPEKIYFQVQNERVTRVQFSVPNEKVEWFLIYGPTPKEILQKYTVITGRPQIPPTWSFGLWLSTSFTTRYDETTVSEILSKMEDHNLPLHTFHFDCFWMKRYQWCDFQFDTDTFPDAAGQIARMKVRGLKICVWINSYIAQESEMFVQGRDKGYLLKRKNGDIWQCDLWQAGMGIVDFTNPEAIKWFLGKLEKLLDMGIDSFKTDFGERIPTEDVVWHDGSCPLKMHNYYSIIYNKFVFGLLQSRNPQACLFARSSAAGGQRFPVHWGGDCESTFVAMAETLRGGLSLGLSGFAFWSHDIGGFEGNPDPDVYKRWIAFGLLSSHSRLHGSDSFRVPWAFDEESVDVLRTFINLKCRLIPYILFAARQARVFGTPVIRAMLLEFPGDQTARYCDRQFMLGESLLIAPIFNSEGDVHYYVPEGKWIGLVDGKERIGPSWVQERHGTLSIPILLRPGHTLVLGKSESQVEYDYLDGFTIATNCISSNVTVEIPDSADPMKSLGSISFQRNNDKLYLASHGISSPWKMKLLETGLEIEIFGAKTVVALE